MTLKDFLRLLRRRWQSALLSALFLFFAFLAVATYAERPQFRARAKVLIATPPVLVTAVQSNQWVAVNVTEPKTWISIVSGRHVREAAYEALRAEDPAADRAWFEQISVSLESEQILWVEAVAPTPAAASAAANAVARTAEKDSLARATREYSEAIRKTETRRAKEEQDRDRERDRAKAERDEVRVRFGVENLELDVKKLQEDTVAHEARTRALERRIQANRLRLERVRNDRVVAEHLQREGAPRLLTASAEARIYENPRVRGLVERLENLHRELMLLLRKYTDVHPQVLALRSDVRESEIELTRARALAVGADIDREELALRSDSEIAAIEQRVLEPELREVRDRLERLRPFADNVARFDARAAESSARLATLDSILAQLQTAPLQGVGYLTPEEPALPQEAARIEMKLRRSYPVAILAALIFGVSIAFLLDMTDGTIRTDFDVRRHLDWATLAVVPKVPQAEVHALAAGRPSVVAETYDMLATVLLSAPAEHASRIFLMTGTNPAEGKTAASINLAAALARQGRRTLLVDGDLRAPAIHIELALANETGLADLLAGRADLDQPGVVQDVAELPLLKVLASGLTPENPYELLDPARIAPAAAAMRERYEAIVIDTPPVLVAGDALKLASAADASVFVVESGRTDVRQATWAKRLLQSVNARIAGALLNRAASESLEYYPSYYTPRRAARSAP